MSKFHLSSSLAAIGLVSILAGQAVADPHPGEALKFYQMPLNNGATPYLPGVPTYPTIPAGEPGYGVPSRAFYPGHDEVSTAYLQFDTATGQAYYQGQYMADDFADYANSPVTHVRWWGSYIDQLQPFPEPYGVKRFLISFEHNVPEFRTSTGEVIPSHPDFDHPGNLHQIVEFVPGALPPPPGKFTEKLLPTPPGEVAPREALYEYNAELNLGKWFNERSAKDGENNVYWLKIVALVEPDPNPTLPPIEWGWHNRDWSIPNALAAKPGDTPDGAERIIGFVPDGTPTGIPIWHFEDDAVTGGIRIQRNPNMPPNMPDVFQNGFREEYYQAPWDGPTFVFGQQLISKDLAFELYTRVIPEPASVALMALGALGFVGLIRRR